MRRLYVLYNAAGDIIQWGHTSGDPQQQVRAGLSVMEVTAPQFIAMNPTTQKISTGAMANRTTAERNTTAQWASVRGERNRRLLQCDWVAMRAQDKSVVTPVLWGVYRQALRDITTQTDPFAITWPTAPVS